MLKYKIVVGIVVLSAAFFAAAANKNERATEVDKTVSSKIVTPLQMNYQGYLASSSDTMGVTGTFSMVFRLYTQESGGSVVWEESHGIVEVDKGVFNVYLGEVIPISDNLFTGDPLWLEIKVGTETLTPRKKIVSVGYSIRAQIADSSTVSSNSYRLDGQTTSDLDARWVNEGQLNSVTSTMITDGTILTADADVGFKAPYAGTADFAITTTGVDVPLDLTGSLSFPSAILTVENTGTGHGIKVTNAGYDGVHVDNVGYAGVFVLHAGDHGVDVAATHHGAYVHEAGYDGIHVRHADTCGLYVGDAWCGVWVDSAYWYPGVYVQRADWQGVYLGTAGANGFTAVDVGQHGFYVGGADWDGVFVGQAGDDGLSVGNATDNGIVVTNAGDNGVWVGNAANDGVHVMHADTYGLYVGEARFGIWVDSTTYQWGDGLYVGKAQDDGIYLSELGDDGLYMYKAGDDGVYLYKAGDDGFTVYEAAGKGAYLRNNNASSLEPTLYLRNQGYGYLMRAYVGTSTLRYYFNGNGYAYADGGWNTFKKNGKGEYESYSAVETAHKEIVSHGTGKLVNAKAHVRFDDSFAGFISSEIPVEITVTPVGSYSGLYIASKDADGFIVKSGAGDPNCEFNWIAIGREKGCEVRAEIPDLDEEMRLTALEDEKEKAEHEQMLAEQERIKARRMLRQDESEEEQIGEQKLIGRRRRVKENRERMEIEKAKTEVKGRK